MQFNVGEHEYQAGKLDAKRQFHVVRRLLPCLAGFTEENISDAEAIKGFMNAVGGIEDEQLDYVIDNCLAVVECQDGGAWAAITCPLPNGRRTMQYQDIGMAEMLTIVYHVIKHNLSGFFDVLPSDLTDKLKGALSI